MRWPAKEFDKPQGRANDRPFFSKRMSETENYPGFRWLVLILASLGFICMQLICLSVTPLVPAIATSLQTDPGTATNLLMTSFLLSSSLMWILGGGYLCDRFGVLVVLNLGFLCQAVPAALMPWIGVSPAGVFGARLVEGLSAGLMFPAMPTIVNSLFPPRLKGIANGLMNSSIAVGSSAGVFLGPLVLTLVGGDWKWMSATLSIFVWVCFIFGLILFFALNSKLPRPPSAATDRTGRSAYRKELVSPYTILGVLVTFIAAWCMQCLYGITAGYLASSKPLGAGYSAMIAGQLMLGVTLLAGVTGPILSGFLLDKAFKGNARPVLLIGYFLMCVFVYLLIHPAVAGNVVLLEIALILAGYGVMFAYPAIFYLIAGSYPPQIVGKMSGLWGGIGAFGGVLGLFLAGVSVKSQGSYSTTLTLQSVVALLGFVLTFLLIRFKNLREAT